MKSNIREYKNYIINLMCPALIFGAVTGVFTAIVVTFYKFCAGHIIEFSESGYELLKAHIYCLPLVVAVLLGAAVVFAILYKKTPNLRGGGIPTSIGILRGAIPFEWFKNLMGVFALSLSTHLIGVPLGTEGPSVQMGTLIGRGSVFASAKKHKAWDRYSMTGGACAGFSTATGAPIAGIIFAVEEVHQNVSPMIIMVASSSVLFAHITTGIISPIFGISQRLFPRLDLPVLEIRDLWLPLIIGLVVGLFSVLFLRYYKLLNHFFGKSLKKLALKYKIFLVFVLTLCLGLCSYSFVSTGHHFIENLFDNMPTVGLLVAILVVRTTITLSANCNGITGGLFLPIMALGATLAAILAKICMSFGVGQEYYAIILVMGITSCISGMMKTPITAIIFAIEALSCSENILAVIIAASVSFILTEIFKAKSITDSVIENRIQKINKDKECITVDTFLTVKEGSFAIGKEIRDILWPNNLFVLSLQHKNDSEEQVDVHGGKTIREGDLLHVRCSTYNKENMWKELISIVGEQE